MTGIVLLGFVSKEQNSKKIWNLDIEVLGNQEMRFVDAKMIKNQLSSLGFEIVGHSLAEIPLDRIRKSVLQNPSVKSCMVYKTLDGQVMVQLEQRTPIARIFNTDGSSMYLDSDGQIMPLSKTFTARVPVVVGMKRESSGRSVDEIKSNSEWRETSLLDDLFDLVNYIRKDELIHAQVDCISINKEGEFEISPRMGRQKIILGSVEDLDLKFKKLKAFYKEIVQVEKLDRYQSINLKYRDQLVCKK